jgi:hypothetical protein
MSMQLLLNLDESVPECMKQVGFEIFGSILLYQFDDDGDRVYD